MQNYEVTIPAVHQAEVIYITSCTQGNFMVPDIFFENLYFYLNVFLVIAGELLVANDEHDIKTLSIIVIQYVIMSNMCCH